MKIIYSIFAVVLMIGCQPAAETVDNSASEAFEKNSKSATTYLEGFQNESIDYAALISKDYLQVDSSFGAENDSTDYDGLIEDNKWLWEGYDFQLEIGPGGLLPGVNVDTKLADGSVRYYGEWTVTRSATDSTEARTAVLNTYGSFDFDEDGKILFEQFYGDVSALMGHLNSMD